MAAFSLHHSDGLLTIRPLLEYDDKGLDEVKKAINGLIDLGDPFIILTDARVGTVPQIHLRARFAEYLTGSSKELRLLCRGWAVVTSSRRHDIAIATLNFIIPRVYPVKVFRDINKATDWLRRKL